MKTEQSVFSAVICRLVCLWAVFALLPAAHAREQYEGYPIQFDSAEMVSSQAGIGRDDEGPYLVVKQDLLAAWDTLRRTVDRKGIPVASEDAREFSLQTDWVLWRYATPEDAVSGFFTGVKANRRQRYRFEFLIDADPNPDHSRIRIVQAMYQVEVDMTPDSAYTWHQWEDALPAAGFGGEFLRLMQLSFAAAVATRLVTPDIVRSIASRSAGRVTPTPQPQEAGRPVIPGADHAVPGIPAEPVSNTLRAGVSQRAVTDRAGRRAPVQASLTPDQGSNVLIVQASVDLTWRALLRSLEMLNVGIDFKDDRQRTLATQWAEMKYKAKSGQLQFPAGQGKSRWAFSLFGDGIQRHRFQLNILPYAGGASALVYVYHVGAQEQIDQTPDSSQTLLVWEDRETQAEIAGAFIRKLRVELAAD